MAAKVSHSPVIAGQVYPCLTRQVQGEQAAAQSGSMRYGCDAAADGIAQAGTEGPGEAGQGC